MFMWRMDKPSEDVICVVRIEILLLCCFVTQSVGGLDYLYLVPYVSHINEGPQVPFGAIILKWFF